MNIHKTAGLTLIEVLIALAIVAIALTAVIKATSQNIRNTDYLQNKTIAMWVASEVMNEAQAGLIHLPDEGEALNQSRNTLGRQWYWYLSQSPTPNKHIMKISVDVYPQERTNDEDASLIHLESYLYHA